MIKKGIKKFLYRKGYYLHTVEKNADELKWITDAGIKTVIDIGAHRGESHRIFRKILPQAAYFAFEPIAECFTELRAKTNSDKNITLFNLALADKTGEAIFYQTDQTHCSSLLQPEENTKQFSGHAHQQKVKLEKLDTALAPYTLEKEILIKIDVQGAEEGVVTGGTSVLSQAKIVLIETSFSSLYQNQTNFHSLYNRMHALGFRYAGAFDQFTEQHTGKVIQQDAIFIRHD